MSDDPVDRALEYGELPPLAAPLQPGDEGAVARWIGVNSGAVLGVSFDPDAEPGSEYDAELWTYERPPGGPWRVRSGHGSDFPTVPGERPIFSRDVFPIVGLDHTISSTAPPLVLTYGVAARDVAAVSVRSADGGVTRAEVGTFGAVILASECPPAEVVLFDHDELELAGRWHLQVHEAFTARSTRPQQPPASGQY